MHASNFEEERLAGVGNNIYKIRAEFKKQSVSRYKYDPVFKGKK